MLKLLPLILVAMLVGCQTKPQVVEKVVIEKVYVPSYKPLDARLTKAEKKPSVPPANCVDAQKGKPTACGEDLWTWIDAIERWGDGMAAQLTEIFKLQPKPKP